MTPEDTPPAKNVFRRAITWVGSVIVLGAIAVLAKTIIINCLGHNVCTLQCRPREEFDQTRDFVTELESVTGERIGVYENLLAMMSEGRPADKLKDLVSQESAIRGRHKHLQWAEAKDPKWRSRLGEDVLGAWQSTDAELREIWNQIRPAVTNYNSKRPVQKTRINAMIVQAALLRGDAVSRSRARLAKIEKTVCPK